MSEEKISRKIFLKKGYKTIFKPITSVLEKSIHTPKYLRPPGAVEETAFVSLCTRCGKCWEVCPHNAIKQSEDDGYASSGMPVVIPDEAPCYLCDPPVCSQVCPEGALKSVTTGNIKIGTATIHKTTCLAHQGIDRNCNYCYDRCPLKDKAILFEKTPSVQDEHCAGCGVCVFYCITNPKSIEIISLG